MELYQKLIWLPGLRIWANTNLAWNCFLHGDCHELVLALYKFSSASAEETVQRRFKLPVWLNTSLLCPPLHDPEVQTFTYGSQSACGYKKKKIPTAIMPRSADLRYGPTVLANDTVKRRSQSAGLPLSPTSCGTYYLIQGVECWVLILVWFFVCF